MPKLEDLPVCDFVSVGMPNIDERGVPFLDRRGIPKLEDLPVCDLVSKGMLNVDEKGAALLFESLGSPRMYGFFVLSRVDDLTLERTGMPNAEDKGAGSDRVGRGTVSIGLYRPSVRSAWTA